MDPGPRPRFVIVYQDRRLPIPDGELVVGRALGCHIRFNAAEVSRQHLTLRCSRGRLVAENLSATTGTLLNGRRMTEPAALTHGDELILGPRRLRVEVEDVAVMAAPPSTADEGEGAADDEATRPGSLSDEELASVPATSIDYHTCPRCRTRVDFGVSRCPGCGYQWSESHPSSVTGRVTLRRLDELERGVVPSEVPVVYASEELTIDALVSDLGQHRAFVPSPLLDPAGTACELTLLPDGVHAMTVRGAVTSVRSIAGAAGPPGMEVRFTEVPPAVRAWLERRSSGRS
jgi:ribosomal protein L37AE/L43A